MGGFWHIPVIPVCLILVIGFVGGQLNRRNALFRFPMYDGRGQRLVQRGALRTPLANRPIRSRVRWPSRDIPYLVIPRNSGLRRAPSGWQSDRRPLHFTQTTQSQYHRSTFPGSRVPPSHFRRRRRFPILTSSRPVRDLGRTFTRRQRLQWRRRLSRQLTRRINANGPLRHLVRTNRLRSRLVRGRSRVNNAGSRSTRGQLRINNFGTRSTSGQLRINNFGNRSPVVQQVRLNGGNIMYISRPGADNAGSGVRVTLNSRRESPSLPIRGITNVHFSNQVGPSSRGDAAEPEDNRGHMSSIRITSGLTGTDFNKVRGSRRARKRIRSKLGNNIGLQISARGNGGLTIHSTGRSSDPVNGDTGNWRNRPGSLVDPSSTEQLAGESEVGNIHPDVRSDSLMRVQSFGNGHHPSIGTNMNMHLHRDRKNIQMNEFRTTGVSRIEIPSGRGTGRTTAQNRNGMSAELSPDSNHNDHISQTLSQHPNDQISPRTTGSIHLSPILDSLDITHGDIKHVTNKDSINIQLPMETSGVSNGFIHLSSSDTPGIHSTDNVEVLPRLAISRTDHVHPHSSQVGADSPVSETKSLDLSQILGPDLDIITKSNVHQNNIQTPMHDKDADKLFNSLVDEFTNALTSTISKSPGPYMSTHLNNPWAGGFPPFFPPAFMFGSDIPDPPDIPQTTPKPPPDTAIANKTSKTVLDDPGKLLKTPETLSLPSKDVLKAEGQSGTTSHSKLLTKPDQSVLVTNGDNVLDASVNVDTVAAVPAVAAATFVDVSLDTLIPTDTKIVSDKAHGAELVTSKDATKNLVDLTIEPVISPIVHDTYVVNDIAAVNAKGILDIPLVIADPAVVGSVIKQEHAVGGSDIKLESIMDISVVKPDPVVDVSAIKLEPVMDMSVVKPDLAMGISAIKQEPVVDIAAMQLGAISRTDISRMIGKLDIHSLKNVDINNLDNLTKGLNAALDMFPIAGSDLSKVHLVIKDTVGKLSVGSHPTISAIHAEYNAGPVSDNTKLITPVDNANTNMIVKTDTNRNEPAIGTAISHESKSQLQIVPDASLSKPVPEIAIVAQNISSDNTILTKSPVLPTRVKDIKVGNIVTDTHTLPSVTKDNVGKRFVKVINRFLDVLIAKKAKPAPPVVVKATTIEAITMDGTTITMPITTNEEFEIENLVTSTTAP